jgi:hypothetical protein|tara:strand:- start:58 stop:516 length:459 start_codon:yes stop_codon:yes gene_type:complete
MKSDYLNSNSGVSNLDLKIVKVNADCALTDAHSGSYILVNPTATTEIDLPALASVAIGWHCSIILTEDTDGSDTGMNQKVNIDFGSGNDVVGHTVAVDGDAGDIAVNNDDYIACSAAATPGDRFDIFTDGSRWYVNGLVADASECPFATAAG